MPPAVDVDALFAEGSSITGLSVPQLQDWMSEEPADQIDILNGWRTLDKMTWTTTPTAVDRLIVIFEALASVAGVVSGIAGATSAVAALRTL